MADDAGSRKAALRDAVLAARHSIGDQARATAGRAIATAGISAWRSVETVAAYLSVGHEPPTRDLVDGLAEVGVKVLLPVIDGNALNWAAYSGPDDLAPGPLGITEPTGPRLGSGGLAVAAVVIVPALSVDRQGNRLGRGRGYYDRALSDIKAPVVAVVYDDELIDDLPVEPHDRRVDAVLRPRGLTSSS